MKVHRNGVTRTVVTVGSIAIKLPVMRYGYCLFLQGLLANLHERFWWRATGQDARLCPVLMGCPLGTFVVMRLANDIGEDQLPPRDAFEGLPLDYKADNFGLLDGNVVLRDYGS